MDIKCVVVGYLDENCYVLSKNGNCLIVDPGDNYNKIREQIGDNKVLGVLITHSHADHIGALRNFLTKRSIKIFKRSNLEEKEYSIGDFKFSVIHTPGHSKDSVTFYFEEDNCMFIGDFIFKDSIGRVDLPGGSNAEMSKSISKILKYDDKITLYPGHGDSTTLGNERKNNPYLK
ncbi:MAG: MBL fold metallo-hydrolase [Bacilli bacterium]|nr:MBL fold metallo-hydrolase [Bacilli bacterium]